MFCGFELSINNLWSYEWFRVLLHWSAVTFVKFILIAVSVAPSWSHLFTDDEHVSLFSFWALPGATLLVAYGFCCTRAAVS